MGNGGTAAVGVIQRSRVSMNVRTRCQSAVRIRSPRATSLELSDRPSSVFSTSPACSTARCSAIRSP